METLGALIGDPDLPEHARSGYEGLLETARELRARLEGGAQATTTNQMSVPGVTGCPRPRLRPRYP
jgi:hypothetical protein